MSDFKIIGNANPVVGVVEHYTVNNLYPKISVDQNFNLGNPSSLPQIKWEVYVLELGKWRKTKENDKIGNLITYKFRHGSLTRAGIRIVAIKGDETAQLDIKPLPSKPKIDDIKLLDKSGKKVEGRLAYGQTVKARVHCLHMEKQRVYVTLWEDDVKGAGHSKANETNFIETKSGIVKDGIADVDFLLKPSFSKIATKNGPENDKVHEYYVTAGLEKVASNNVNVNEPEAPVKPHKAKTIPKLPTKPSVPTGESKTNSPKSTATAAPKKAKAQINSVNLTDTAGHQIKGTFREKQIKVWINSTGLKGKKIRLKLYDDDITSNDLLFQEEFTLGSDLHAIVVPLNTIPRSLGGNYWTEGSEQELFAEVEVLQTDIFKKSTIVDVDATVFKQDPVEVTNKVKKVGGAKGDRKDKKKGNCYCNRDITAAELTTMVKNIRDNTYYNNKTITFYHSDKLFYLYAKVPQSDRTFEKFAEVLNKAFVKHAINTCARKIHFLANMYVETMYFTATREGKGTSGFRYDPYRGRGFQHLTWEDNYKKYKKESGIDIVNDYEKVADDLNIAADTGAWYWSKTGINVYADKDSIFDTSRLINYPGASKSSSINGYKDREIAWRELKKIFKFPQNCISDKKANTPSKDNCPKCKVLHFDLTDKVKWQTQFDPKWGDSRAQNVACKKTCDDILNKNGLTSTSKLSKYQTALENSNHTALIIDTEESKRGIKYLDLQLQAGNPVQVGVDHDLNYKGGTLNEGTTDHFIVIVGKSCENGKIYYRFYDVGTRHENKGASTDNRLYLNTSNYSLKGKTVYNNHVYTVSQIRNNKKK